MLTKCEFCWIIDDRLLCKVDYRRLFVQKGQKTALKSRKLISEGEEMNSGKNRLFAMMLAVVLVVSLTFVPSVFAAEANNETPEADQSLSGTSVSGEYQKYLSDLKDKEYAKEDIVINPLDYSKIEGNEFSNGFDEQKDVMYRN